MDMIFKVISQEFKEPKNRAQTNPKTLRGTRLINGPDQAQMKNKLLLRLKN